MSQNRGGSTEPNISDLGMPTPPEDWALNHLLHDIAASMSPEELEKIKHLFQGTGGFGRGTLEKITTHQQLFNVLRGRGFISRDNLIYLQQALRTLGRKDLFQKAIEYARQAGDVIHFYPASEQPENGYTYIKVHVGGKDFSTYRRKDLDALRFSLSSILMAPPEAILFAGIEPSLSLVITIMIPEEYANLMRHMLQEGQEFPELTEIDADVVKIGDSVFRLQGKHTQTAETEQHSKLATVYQQLQDKSRQLENLQQECIALTSKQEHTEMSLVAIMKQGKDQGAGTDSEQVICQGEKAYMDFCQALKEADEKGYDKNLIGQLLNSNTAVVAIGIGEQFRSNLQRLGQNVISMKVMQAPLKLELIKYQTLLSRDIDQLIAEQLLAEIEMVLQQQGTVSVLRTISSSLAPKERERLMREYQWDKDDILKQIIEREKEMFLEVILSKENQKTQQPVDLAEFIPSCLGMVGREDLKKTFLQKVAKIPLNETPESGTHKPGAGRVSPDQKVNGDVIQQDMELKDTINKMASQVEKIYSTMQSTMSTYGDSFSHLKQPLFCGTNFDGADFNSRQSFPAN